MASRPCHEPRTSHFHRGGHDGKRGHALGLVLVQRIATTASLLWRGFAASPRGMLVLAFRGWLMGLLLAFGAFVCIAVGIGLYPRLPLAESTAVLSRAVYAADLVGLTLCQFLVGRWLARRAPGRELSAGSPS